jgi:putative transposase
MENYRRSSHETYDLKYHIVWITKYRKLVLSGKAGERTRELIRQVCKTNDVEILAGHAGKDHIHLLVSIPPHLSVSKLVQYVKGYSSRKLLMEYKELQKQYWGRHLWARGYFAATTGNITDEIIVQYI